MYAPITYTPFVHFMIGEKGETGLSGQPGSKGDKGDVGPKGNNYFVWNSVKV